MAAKKAEPGSVHVEITSLGLEKAAMAYLEALSPKKRRDIIQAATFSAIDAVKKYYSDGSRKMWINPRLPTHGPGRKPTQWWRGTANGWKTANINSRSSELVNAHIGLAHKVTGGTIRPVRAKRLAIPLVPAAHGLTPRTYAKTIAPLFPMGNALGQKKGEPVYALKREVTQKPWKDALPKTKTYMRPYEETFMGALIDEFKTR